MMKIMIVLGFLLTSFAFASSHTCNDTILSHSYYKTCFSKNKKLARWVSYTLNEEMFRGNANRENEFFIDPLIPKYSLKPEHYYRSGFDRGHLVPAADMKITDISMRESFFMTNVAAQSPSFNRGVWKRAENLIRGLTSPNKNYEVISGLIFDFRKKTPSTSHLNIAKAFYKIIFYHNKDEIKVLAFLIPHKKSQEDLRAFLVPVDTIEALTNIDFFQDLPDSIEDQIESKSRPHLWGL